MFFWLSAVGFELSKGSLFRSKQRAESDDDVQAISIGSRLPVFRACPRVSIFGHTEPAHPCQSGRRELPQRFILEPLTPGRASCDHRDQRRFPTTVVCSMRRLLVET